MEVWNRLIQLVRRIGEVIWSLISRDKKFDYYKRITILCQELFFHAKNVKNQNKKNNGIFQLTGNLYFYNKAITKLRVQYNKIITFTTIFIFSLFFLLLLQNAFNINTTNKSLIYWNSTTINHKKIHPAYKSSCLFVCVCDSAYACVLKAIHSICELCEKAMWIFMCVCLG